MSSRKYRSYKFIYTNDLEQNVIKQQRVYLDDNDSEIIPITPLFLARVVNSNQKVTGTSRRLRHLLACIAGHKFQINLPYSNNNSSFLVNHIKEILATNRVDCANYRGETSVTDGSSNSIQ